MKSEFCFAKISWKNFASHYNRSVVLTHDESTTRGLVGCVFISTAVYHLERKEFMETETIQQILALLPPEYQEKLFMVLTAHPINQSALEKILEDGLTTLDTETRQKLISELIGQLLPLDTLVPDIYQRWRPIVRDAAIYWGAHLSNRRLIPKLARQFILPVETSLERRLLIFIEQMPALQKIGQSIARNRHLTPTFRDELTRLENSIQDIRPAEIFTTVQQQLGTLFSRYEIEMQTVLLAEASVSAVVRFSWQNPTTNQREQGVFKVLKPYVIDYFAEDLDLLRGLTEHLEQNRALYQLPAAGLREMLDEVRHLLEQETALSNEQAMLTEAYIRYQGINGIRVPRLIQELSTPYITAMSEENGAKVTDALRHQTGRQKRQLAERIIVAVLAVPLFAEEEQSLFHADLHAGNLAVKEETGELLILDWALVDRLSREQRRHFVILFIASAWRDPERIFAAIAYLCSDDLSSDTTKATLVRGHIATYLAQLSPFASSITANMLMLLDAVMTSGIRFPSELLLFRKMLFTLMDVLNEVAPDCKVEPVLVRYALTLLSRELPQRLQLSATDTLHDFGSHLTNKDLTVWLLTLPLVGNRLWLQVNEQMVNQGLDRFQQIFGKQMSFNPRSWIEKVKPTLSVAANSPVQTSAVQQEIMIPIVNLVDE
ncbi:MAG: AarF/UbiB family protein [Caldilineaceae bacterium]